MAMGRAGLHHGYHVFMRSLRFVWAVVLLIALQGCGGDGATGIDSSSQTFSGYGITATYQGKGNVQTLVAGTNTGGAAFTGLYGVSFTSVITEQTQNLANTKIAFGRAGELWAMNGDFTNETEVTKVFPHTTADGLTPAISPNGRVAAVSLYDPVTGFPQIYFAALDGSSLVKVTSLSTGGLQPSWNSSGTTCVFNSGNKIYKVAASGGTPTLVGFFLVDAEPLYSRDGAKIYFEAGSGSQTAGALWSMNADGSSPAATSVTAPIDPVGGMSLSPDGFLVASSTGTAIQLSSLVTGETRVITSPPTGVTDDYPSFSPDGKTILFTRHNTNASQLLTCTFDGINPQQQTTGLLGYETATWGPFPRNQQVIGPAGNLATGASGFLMGEVGPALVSFVAFTATTPSSATIAPQAQTNDNCVFQIKGDAITKLAFVNDLSTSATTVIPVTGLTTAGGALVSFGTLTGRVVLVVPFSPGTPKMAALKSGTTLTYTGVFPGIWNGAGRNLAPGGAHTVSIDSRTGALISFS